jgi:hypothetical protein
MEITLKTKQQFVIADLLWVAQSEEEVAAIIKVFGSDAILVRELMIAAAMDEVQETHLAERVLVDIMSK